MTDISATELSALLDTAVDAATRAGDMARSRIEENFSVAFKENGIHNLVTEVDTQAEDLIKQIISERHNGARFLAEESGGNEDLGPLTWVVDPIDGTVNFAHGIPIYCVSIAAVVDNEPVVGAIYNPNLKETFTAIRGKGAFLNGKPLKVSTTNTLREAFLVTGFPYNVAENPFGCIDSFMDFVSMGIPVRRLGSAALDLAYTAAGRFDGFWEVMLNPWDVAAGVLMLAEAGGSVRTYGDRDQGMLVTDRLLATNGRVADEMNHVLQNPGAYRKDRS